MYRVTARYLGAGKAEVRAGERAIVVNQKTEEECQGPGLCPVELLLASLGA